MRRLAITLLLTGWLAGPALAADARKPNVLIVITDDQGLGDFSYTGNPHLKTPNLDAFAKQSVQVVVRQSPGHGPEVIQVVVRQSPGHGKAQVSRGRARS